MPRYNQIENAMINRILLTVLLLVFLTGCSSNPLVRIVEKPIYVNRAAPILPTVQPIEQHPIDWIIITEDNLDDVLKKMETENKRIVFFAMTPEDYEILTMNAAEVRRYIQQQNAVLSAYKEYADMPPIPPQEQEKPVTKPFWKVW